MPSKTIDAQAVCPFYLADLKRGIRCEGHTDEETSIREFVTIEAKEKCEQCFCCDTGGYEKCPHFRALMAAKYADAM